MTDDATTTSIEEISDDQWIVLYALQIFSSTLSIIGSSVIVIKILRDYCRHKSPTPYDRIVLGMSTCDIFASLTYATNQFLWPPETGYMWAFGNAVTCPIVGFFQQLAPGWSIYYNCALSCYFLLTLLSQRRKINYVQKYEKWLHITGLFWPVTSFLGLVFGWYDELEGFCEITDPTITLLLVAIPFVCAYSSQIITNVAIYAVVRTTLRLPRNASGPTMAQKRVKKEAATIMLLYIGSCFTTVSPLSLRYFLVILFGYGYYDVRLFWLLALESFLLPLQGFFNFFIYIKPAYTRFRTANPDESVCYVLYQALYNPKTPRTSYHPKLANGVTAAETEGGGSVDIIMKNANLSCMDSSRMFYNPNKVLFDADAVSRSSELPIPVFTNISEIPIPVLTNIVQEEEANEESITNYDEEGANEENSEQEETTTKDDEGANEENNVEGNSAEEDTK